MRDHWLDVLFGEGEGLGGHVSGKQHLGDSSRISTDVEGGAYDFAETGRCEDGELPEEVEEVAPECVIVDPLAGREDVDG